ncbi:acetylhydrolase [Oceaniferula spumae]|uniref:Acetylhydrolase n=1 Tax=Oceaniferula spumae TaxID=2979115 RepID=A0AAT9FM91_9BACT
MQIWKLTFACFVIVVQQGWAEIKWIDPVQDGTWLVEGRITQEPGYKRLPAAAKGKVRPPVWGLSQHSAGLKIRFWSNSPEIHLKYQLTSSLSMPHMPATGISGFDLYRRTSEGKQFWVACSKPTSQQGKIKLAAGLASNPRVPALYTLYLPLYNGVQSLQIGVPEGKSLEPAAVNILKPIIVYGTSIAQGACASRPGLAWTNILERRLDWPVVNLGFSGNGRMEPEVADFILGKDAAVYVIDCLPNMNAQEVQQRIAPLLDRIRKTRPHTPVLLVEGAPRDNARWNHDGKNPLAAEWAALRGEYEKRKVSDKNLHYLAGENLLGQDGNATVDGVHPNDIGMMRYADAYENTLRPVLGLKSKDVIDGVPATPQLREIPGYNFMLRHQLILARNRAVKSDVAWLGDSIIHFFGGEPEAHLARGADAWGKLFAEHKVANLAYGWDRTENVLWRIQRGELDAISPKTILLSIGTNDLSIGRTPQQVSNSILNLVREIKARQPSARIIVTGILPRGNHMQNVIATNAVLQKTAQQHGYQYLDLTSAFPLVEKNGKRVLSGMNGDQLHPNTEGYTRIAEIVAKHL